MPVQSHVFNVQAKHTDMSGHLELKTKRDRQPNTDP